MTTSPFLTFSEVAAYLRYDIAGPDGAKQTDALRKWLSKYGCRPSLKRGLYRLEVIEAAIARLDAAQTGRRRRGFKNQQARLHASQSDASRSCVPVTSRDRREPAPVDPDWHAAEHFQGEHAR